MPESKEQKSMVVPNGLEWHHKAFQKLGIIAHEYEIMTFAFPAPRADMTVPLAVDPVKKNELSKNLSKLYGKSVTLPKDGILRLPVSSFVAILDDEFETEVRPASALFMNIEPHKTYDFVVALQYSEDGRHRQGRVLFLEPQLMSKREWTDPGHRFSLKSTVIFYPSITAKSKRCQLSAVHPSGKRIVISRNCPEPPFGERVTVRLIEKIKTLIAIPITSVMTEEEIVKHEQKAMSAEVVDKPEMPEGHVFDGQECVPSWDALNRHAAELEGRFDFRVFDPGMSLESFSEAARRLRAQLSPDAISAMHPALVRARTKRSAIVGHFLDTMKAYLEKPVANPSASAPGGNGRGPAANKVAVKKPARSKKTKPASA